MTSLFLVKAVVVGGGGLCVSGDALCIGNPIVFEEAELWCAGIGF